MKVAVPVANDQLCMHFGHCEAFQIMTVDPEKKSILSVTSMVPPMHEPGVLPRWLAGMEVRTVLAGGMGQRAQAIFSQHGVEAVVGVQGSDPREVVINWMNGSLATGTNTCDH